MTPLTPAGQKLAADNLGLAFAAARREKRTLLDYDERLSACLMALTRCAGSFDPSRGFKFSTYATSAMKMNMMRESLARTVSNPGVARLRRQRPTKGELTKLNDPGRRDSHDHMMGSEIWTWAESYLTARELLVLRMRMGEGVILSDVGKLLGITREHVRQIEARAIARLREAAERE